MYMYVSMQYERYLGKVNYRASYYRNDEGFELINSLDDVTLPLIEGEL